MSSPRPTVADLEKAHALIAELERELEQQQSEVSRISELSDYLKHVNQISLEVILNISRRGK